MRSGVQDLRQECGHVSHCHRAEGREYGMGMPRLLTTGPRPALAKEQTQPLPQGFPHQAGATAKSTIFQHNQICNGVGIGETHRLRGREAAI